MRSDRASAGRDDPGDARTSTDTIVEIEGDHVRANGFLDLDAEQADSRLLIHEIAAEARRRGAK